MQLRPDLITYNLEKINATQSVLHFMTHLHKEVLSRTAQGADRRRYPRANGLRRRVTGIILRSHQKIFMIKFKSKAVLNARAVFFFATRGRFRHILISNRKYGA